MNLACIVLGHEFGESGRCGWCGLPAMAYNESAWLDAHLTSLRLVPLAERSRLKEERENWKPPEAVANG